MNPASLGPWADAALALAGTLGLLVPLGLLLLSLSSNHPSEVAERGQTALLAAGSALLGYGLVGFGLQWGGVGLVSPLPGLAHLTREWEPLVRRWGEGWGLFGLEGSFLLDGGHQSQELALFVHQAPLVASVALLVSLVLVGRVSLGAILLGALALGGLLYPLIGNWIWGGGWLSQLGSTRGLGYGVVDYGGSGVVYGLAGVAALAAMLTSGVRRDAARAREPVVEPPAHLPILALGGAVLVWLGSLPWMALHLQATADLSLARIGANLLWAGTGGLASALLYTWFTTGRPVLIFLARGLVGGTVAVAAGAPFMVPLGALTVGLVAGLLVCLVQYLVERSLGLNDTIGAVAVYGSGGLWGLLAVALFASGRWGSGWNQVSAPGYRGATGLGVAGFAASPGLEGVAQPQLVAQLVGIGSLGLVAFFGAWLVYALARVALPVPGVRERLRERLPVPRGRFRRASLGAATVEEAAPASEAATPPIEGVSRQREAQPEG